MGQARGHGAASAAGFFKLGSRLKDLDFGWEMDMTFGIPGIDIGQGLLKISDESRWRLWVFVPRSVDQLITGLVILFTFSQLHPLLPNQHLQQAIHAG